MADAPASTTEAATAAAAAPAASSAAASATSQTQSPTLGSVIKGALATLGDKARLGTDLATRTQERDAARAEVTTRTQERDQARTDLAAAHTQLDTLATFFGCTRADFTGKDAAALNAVLAQKISAQAVEALAGAGVPQAELPVATKVETPSAASKTLTYAQFSKLSAGEKMEFSANGGRISE